MTTPRITTIEQLHSYLYAALQLEHATIPPYLVALYSLHPETNHDAQRVLRVVVVEEMLHLTLVANVLNATGGTPDLTRPDFVPLYPARLPDGESDFEVSLQAFSKESVATFLNIERPGQAPSEEARLVRRERSHRHLLAASPEEPGMQFFSIGEFYEEIGRGIRYLHQRYAEQGRQLFTGDPARQVTPEYFYSGGGEVIGVTDLDSAEAAMRLIAEQGEGLGHGIYDNERELAHYYRFQQLELGRYYQPDDQPGHATGPLVDTDWDAVYPVAKNARLADYPPDSELYAAAAEFNKSYADFLSFLTQSFNGQPGLLIEAVWRMFRIRDVMIQLIRNPLPGQEGVNAAPTFEMAAVMERTGS